LIIDTTYDMTLDNSITKSNNMINIAGDVSLISGAGPSPLYSSQIYAKVYRDDNYVESKYFSLQDLMDYTSFSLTYKPTHNGEYSFIVYVVNDYEPASRFLFNNTITVNWVINLDGESNIGDNQGDIDLSAFPWAIGVVTVPGIVFVFSNKAIKNSRKTYKTK